MNRMTHLEIELVKLKKSILKMLALSYSQLENSCEALITNDLKLAKEVTKKEKKMNAIELDIDMDCENILALFQPVATDLRFVISALKINSDIERIGDYADGIADYVLEMEKPISKNAIKATKVKEMFSLTLSMIDDITTSLKEEDTDLARTIFKKDAELNHLNKDAAKTIRDLVVENPESIKPLLYLFSVIRKLERVGDHVKNISEDAIFYIEAEKLKHKKLKRKLKKKD